MIEADGLPVCLAMTVGAFIAKVSAMRFVFLVTVDAERGSFPVGLVRDMTAVAARNLVCALQAEIRVSVIEGLLVKLHDIGITPLMLGMAVIALGVDAVGP